MSATVWIVLAILIGANSLYVAAEFAAVSVRRSRVRRLAEEGGWLARRLLPFLEDAAGLDRYVGVSQIGITLSSLVLGAVAQATLSEAMVPVLNAWLGMSEVTALSLSAGLVLATMTALQLVLGELVPKALALQYPTETALATVLPMRWSLAVFRPLLVVLNGAALLLLRALGAAGHTHRHLHSPEEIDLLIAESRDGGLLEPEEQQRLRRALHLGTRKVRDLMVPLAQLAMLQEGAPAAEILHQATATPYSRLPVYRGSREQVVGFIRVKDLAERYASDGRLGMDRLLRPISRLDEQLPADRAVYELRDRRAHLAAVTDQQNRVIGLITVHDLLNELLGPRTPAGDPPRGEGRERGRR
ncbi:MAG: HlyC/CorC family transporter [Acidobacteria bacterium]|nr:HlyC/CorC family transporter [Acidobacteriota bacterium]